MAMSLKPEDLKAKGNVCFQQGDYVGAEKYYTQAIIRDSSNAAFFTNRALARLKQEHWEGVIQDCHKALEIQPNSLKAYTFLGQANLHLDRPNEALSASLSAYKLAVEQRSPSVATIAQVVLAAKKRKWEISECKRIEAEGELLKSLIKTLWDNCDNQISELRRLRERRNTDNTMTNEPNPKVQQPSRKVQDFRQFVRKVARSVSSSSVSTVQTDIVEEKETLNEFDAQLKDEVEIIKNETQEKIEQMKEVFARADPSQFKKRTVPDYFIDPISFTFMQDPVITKNGRSYERSAILEHLKRSKTDPLTREPLAEEDLRANISLKEACDDFLKENGWAVDY